VSKSCLTGPPPLAGNEEACQSTACVEVINGAEVQLNEHGTAKDVLRAHRLRNRRFAFDSALDGLSLQVPPTAMRLCVRCVLYYSDEKVANRDIRVWHLVIENGY
jgi:hypothetical protein